MRLLFVLAAAFAAFDCLAAKAFKCTNAQGDITYQQVQCPNGDVQRRFDFRPEPPRAAAAAPEPKRAARKPPRASRRTSTRAAADAPVATSYECRVANGEVFYVHGPCPAAVVAVGSVKRDRGRGRSATPAQMTAVSARPISRDAACRRINAASASSRAGHQRDETVSTYEKNLGRDPCR